MKAKILSRNPKSSPRLLTATAVKTKRTVCPFARTLFSQLVPCQKEQRAGLSIIGMLKSAAYGWKQTLLINASACCARELCVKACQKQALTLARI